MASKPSMSINLGLPPAPEVDSPELYGALMPLFNALRNLGYGLDAYTGNTLITPDEYSQVNSVGQLLAQKTAILYARAMEDISVGHIVSIQNDSGLAVRLASGGTYQPHAFALAAATSGSHVPVCMFGLCQSIGGLTPGTEYYVSSTPGLITPTASYRKLGVALGPSQLWFAP